MLTKFQTHLNDTNLLPPRSKLVVAVSGGVDSVSLLHLLSQLKDFYNWQLVVAHFDHKTRADSYKDAELVASLAEAYGYPYYLQKYSGSSSSEASLRKARYDFLENLLVELNYDYLLTAHHNNDRIETAIFNTIRGADRDGMTSLRPRRGNIVRPLLSTTKAEIITYAELQKLPYREDSSNVDVGFSRNFVRHGLVPQGSMVYRNFNHSFTKKLNELASLNQRIDAQLEDLVSEISTKRTPTTVELDRVMYRGLSPELAASLLVYIARQIMPGIGLSKQNIAKAEKFLLTAKSGSTQHLKSGLHLAVDYDTLKVTCQSDNPPTQVDLMTHVLTVRKPFENDNFLVKIIAANKKADNSVELLDQKLYVRYRQPGDKLYPAGMKGSKKLQEVFVDKKIPRSKRATWPVVVNGKNEVVWLAGVAVDRRAIVDPKKHRTINLTCEVKDQ